MRRLFFSLALVLLVSAIAAPVPAAAQQSISFNVGGFVPRGEDARDEDDVLFNNLGTFAFDVKDFNGATVGAEWLFQVHDVVEAGIGLGYYSNSVHSFYLDFQEDDGSEIEQDLKLRIVPFTATVRFLPLGREAAVQPYIGAGVGVFVWRYSETGEFIDNDGFVFTDRFTSSGANAGPVILAGLRFPVGSVDLGGELRYQSALGDLDDDFFGTKIDLGGFSYLFNVNVRF